MNGFRDNNRLWQGGRRRVIIGSAAALFLIITSVAIFSHGPSETSQKIDVVKLNQAATGMNGEPVSRALDANNVLMTDKQCSETFPRLFEEVDKAVARRKGKKIKPEELAKGQVRGFVYNQQVSLNRDECDHDDVRDNG